MRITEIKSLFPAEPFEVEIGGQVAIRGRCRPGAISESVILRSARGAAQIAEEKKKDAPDPAVISAATEQVMEASREILVNSVVEWDLEDADGTPLPINDESVSRLDFELRAAIAEVVTNAQRPNQETAVES